jgi:hypothetical protein
MARKLLICSGATLKLEWFLQVRRSGGRSRRVGDQELPPAASPTAYGNATVFVFGGTDLRVSGGSRFAGARG